MKFGQFTVGTAVRVAKEELFPEQCVMTMHKSNGENTARTFSFNSKAADLMNINDNDVHKFTALKQFTNNQLNFIGIVNVNQEPFKSMKIASYDVYKVTIGQPKKFSNKRLFETLNKWLNLDKNVDNNFLIEKLEEDSVTYFQIKMMNENEKEIETEVSDSVSEDEVRSENESANIY